MKKEELSDSFCNLTLDYIEPGDIVAFYLHASDDNSHEYCIVLEKEFRQNHHYSTKLVFKVAFVSHKGKLFRDVWYDKQTTFNCIKCIQRPRCQMPDAR